MEIKSVSMPSRASTSLLPDANFDRVIKWRVCQCPLGLVPHCYTWLLIVLFNIVVCQCPLGLVPHCYQDYFEADLNGYASVNALSG